MKNLLTAKQLIGWQTYASIEPFGEYRSELRHGQMMHLLDAANFKREKSVTPKDFMNFVDHTLPSEKILTEEEIEAVLKATFGV
ncbi:MAG: hypothetical protein FWD70_07340 [Desulfuromonadales bacterium]|nr:hypothetical protein [Desulfuromonadales bacterium]